ncbi:hypothetical protein Pla108_17440 [Botrimarina colliarenosi]|uniref:PEP-CTERM protein-sorting domain-containing protein n=1 Tax=Botrimarina colliarenosi TaxID=2528001 RepID=A0A5C6AC31_9BACT|nr:hypothetical protein [Botrimarina colliarenosi]TWT97592.1 hypothetical protein Pla108_17440 [Botrimarina colliarenosi]
MARSTLLLATVIGLFGSSSCWAGVDLLCSSSNANVTVIYEGTGRLTSGSLALDSSPSGQTSIQPGLRFDSYLIKIDDFSSLSPSPFYANFNIDGPVIGLQTDVSSLQSGRQTLNGNGFEAGAPAGGIESSDTVTLNGQSLTVNGKVGGQGVDPIRVFVEATAVPEIASAAVWSVLSIGGVVTFGRGRRR